MPRPDRPATPINSGRSPSSGSTRGNAPGAVLVKMGRTTVLCTCCVEPKVPDWIVGRGKGWMTAEYGMLPGSTDTRKSRDKGGKDRWPVASRFNGSSAAACARWWISTKLGERTLWIDCDVLEADGGTRTASINGAFVAVVDALNAIRRRLAAPGSRRS